MPLDWEKDRLLNSANNTLQTVELKIHSCLDPVEQAIIAIGEGDTRSLVVTYKVYNRMLSVACHYVESMLYHQAKSSDDSSKGYSSDYARRIMRLSFHVNSMGSDSPQSVWPTLHFLAATACNDSIYEMWVVTNLRASRKRGLNYCKAAGLLESVVRRRRATQTQVDMRQVMYEPEGSFVI